MKRDIRRRLIVTAVLAAMPGVGAAQRIEGSMVSIAADHELLGDNLAGVGARVRLPWTADRSALYLGFERVTGTSRRVGATCAGFVPPNDPCLQPEPLLDDARLWTASAALSLRALTRSRVVVDVAPALRLGHVRANTRGETSGGDLSASQTLIGVDIGVDATWAPFQRIPVAVSAGVGVGAMVKALPVSVEDGYDPFGGFRLARFRVGASWWPRGPT